ncbi:GNAT family N-acetyltransferase, partial [Candidatus Parcubacteria bacterium]|nr:GNAT family N-acetyltransferase [Candidatus Parcubacteria bacterium]
MITYYKIKDDEDFKFVVSLFKAKNTRYFETKRISEGTLKRLSSSPYRGDYILLLGRKKIGWFNIRMQIQPKSVGVFGIIIDYPYQGKGYGSTAMRIIEKEAKILGI